MRFEAYLIDEAQAADTGAKGKAFERIFVKALSLVGLDFEEQNYAGKVFDLKSKGSGWKKLFNNKNINVKVHGAKWMFSSKELTSMLPWSTKKIPSSFDAKDAGKKVRQLFNKKGFTKVVFLKPKDKSVQADIIRATKAEDTAKLRKIFQGNNFYADQLTDYSVRVLHNTERVTSIAADKAGKVFMRSEKPRNMGAGKGTDLVTFRTPSTKLDGTDKSIMT